jgi:hypothetical protein
VRAILEDLGIEREDLPEVALRYVLSHPAVSTVIPGMRSVRNVQRNAALGDAGACPRPRAGPEGPSLGPRRGPLAPVRSTPVAGAVRDRGMPVRALLRPAGGRRRRRSRRGRGCEEVPGWSGRAARPGSGGARASARAGPVLRLADRGRTPGPPPPPPRSRSARSRSRCRRAVAGEHRDTMRRPADDRDRDPDGHARP